MDVIERERIKVPNAVLISGFSGTETDEEVVKFLQHYGSIARTVKIASSDPDFKDTVIVEFEYGTAIESIQGELPCHRTTSDPNVVHSIQLLSPIYSAKLTASTTESYLSNLKGIAKVSGVDYEKMLLSELNKLQASAGERESTAPSKVISVDDPVPSIPGSVLRRPSSETIPPTLTTDTINPSLTDRPAPILNPEHLTTPEVQRVIVEHIVKSTDMSQSYPSSVKFRSFSGKTPCPNTEVDYDTWRSHVEFYLADSSVPERQVVRKIIDSLLPPAANIVKQLGPLSSLKDFLSLLDSAYGTVDDVDELFAKFLSTNQNAGEKPSAYVHRLQTTLDKVVKGGGVPVSDFDQQLLKQFCRGCWDDNLIASLHLEQKKSSPPSFSELLLLLRTEEDKQAAKSTRMKQHLGISKVKVQSNPLNVYPTTEFQAAAATDSSAQASAKKLQKQIAQLQEQLSSLKASMETMVAKKPQAKFPKAVKKQQLKEAQTQNSPLKNEGFGKNKKPRPWFCFNCGEDGHIAPSCDNEPNPSTVEAKRKELRVKQKAWEDQCDSDLN